VHLCFNSKYGTSLRLASNEEKTPDAVTLAGDDGYFAENERGITDNEGEVAGGDG
jgi:hypothetical protein